MVQVTPSSTLPLLHQASSSSQSTEMPPGTISQTPTSLTNPSTISSLQSSPVAPQFSPIGAKLSPAVPRSESHEDEIQSETSQQRLIHSIPRPLYGFKLVGDNIDWMVHPRFVRFDQQTQSIHCFHSYALKDRIDLSGRSDVPPKSHPSMSEVMSKVFPSAHEESLIHDEFAILLSRMLCSHMTYFKETFADVIDRHIKHSYSSEMSTRSEAVSSCIMHNFSCSHVCV